MVVEYTGGGIYIGERYVYTSHNNTIFRNTVTSNGYGITLVSSYSNTVIGNNITYNDLDGILMADSPRNTLRNNSITNNGLNFAVASFWGSVPLEHFIQDIDASNTVDGKPIYYYVNQHNQQVPEDAGYVAAVNSTNITIRNLTLTQNYFGGLFAYTNNSNIEGITITNNDFGFVLVCSWRNTISESNIYGNGIGGIYFQYSFNNTVRGNNIYDNKMYGIVLEESNSSSIYHNNFLGRVVHVFSYESKNIWDNSYPSGGNYWSDYAGVDLFSGPYQNMTGSDGIGDTPKPINENNVDHYPLMNRTPTPPGDINRDGKVDMKDVAIAAMAFGSYAGHPRWNPIADQNEDGKIDMRDIALVAKNFGKTYP
jgi:parallel beta-helix repeat protein